MGERREHYLSSWEDEYAEEADVELVVGGDILPAHRHVLSISPIFRNALRLCDDERILVADESSDQVSETEICIDEKAAKTGEKVRLESAFVGVAKEDMCLLLDHVYSTDALFNVQDIENILRVIILADRFGFVQLAQKCLKYLTEIRCIRESFQSKLYILQSEPLAKWIWVAQRFPCEMMKNMVAKCLADNYSVVLAPKASGKWKYVRMSIEGDLWRRISLDVHDSFVRALEDVATWSIELQDRDKRHYWHGDTGKLFPDLKHHAKQPLNALRHINQTIETGSPICSRGAESVRLKRT